METKERITRLDIDTFHIACADVLNRSYDRAGMRMQLYMHPGKYRRYFDVKRLASALARELERD